MSGAERLLAHLATGATTVCRAWAVTRKDRVVLGFTDHDGDLSFDGIAFRANTGLSARALQQATGLSVDNSEAMGALTAASVTEEDLIAGRYDGAEVRAWLVNWADVEERMLQFSGSFGEIVRSGGAFRAELRGLTEGLNQPQGRSFQKTCSAVLGDRHCRFDLSQPGFGSDRPVEVVAEGRVFRFGSAGSFPDRWFERGRATMVSGAGAGAVGLIKNDRIGPYGREIEMWQPLDLRIASGDMVRLDPGCDKREATCRGKFANFMNFRGFPHIPGEDWLISYPVSAGVNDGGSRVR
jgi:uncharacterized phage protein (TIGR02218 family)